MMQSVATAYIDYPAVAFTTDAQFLPSGMMNLELRRLLDRSDDQQEKGKFYRHWYPPSRF